MAIARALLEDLSDHRWVILLRGIFGVLACRWSGATLLALVFGITLTALFFRVRGAQQKVPPALA